MPDPGWFADPTGRFGQRWFDGSTWTSSVVGANGGVIEDAAPALAAPAGAPVAPMAAAPVAPMAPVAPGPAMRPGPQGAPSVRYGVGAGLVLGLVGLVLVALSLFVVPWGKADMTRFTDFTSRAHKVHPTSYPTFGIHLNFVYVSWLAYVLFAAVAVLTVLAGIPVPHTGAGNRFWRIGASLLAGVALTVHTVDVTYVFHGSGQTAGFGALSGMFGYGVVLVAMIFGARRIVRAPGRTW